MKRKEVLTENPLAIALMGALVGMGLEKEKAKKAAAQAVNDAQTGAWKDPDKQPAAARAPQGADYNQIMKRGSRGEGVKQLQRNLGMTGAEVDGIFGPATEKAVRTFQKNSGAKVDGIVGPETRARIMKLASDAPAAGDQWATRRNAALDRVTGTRIDPGTTAGGPSKLKQRLAAQTGEGVTMTDKKQLDEASININGADASEVAEILRMMQLAGADGAKVVGPDDINPGPKPCPICGKIHGPSQPMGGCGAKPKEPGMGDMIKLMAPGEAMEEETDDGDFQDASTEPDEEYANDVSASIPAGNDLHKEKGSYPATAGGDNPMNTEDEDLEEQIKSQLRAALAARK